MNLVQNAFDAVVAARIPQPGVWVSVDSDKVNALARVTVCDNGPGILPEHLLRIF